MLNTSVLLLKCGA